MTCLDLTTLSPRDLAERAGEELEGAPPLEVLRWAVDRFSPRFATEKPQEPIVIPPDPGYSDASVTRGAACP